MPTAAALAFETAVETTQSIGATPGTPSAENGTGFVQPSMKADAGIGQRAVAAVLAYYDGFADAQRLATWAQKQRPRLRE